MLGLLYAWLPPCPDHAIFDYAGWVVSGGGSLYLDVAEQNFPGIMWLHALATWLFGNHEWSFRTLDYALLLPFCWLLHVMLQRVCPKGTACIVVPLYQVMYVTVGVWSAGSRDLLAAHMLIAGGFACHLRRTGRSVGWLVVGGGLIAWAILVRPTYALFPALFVGADFLAACRRRRGWADVLGDAAVTALVVVVLLGSIAWVAWTTGQLQEWYRLAVAYNIHVYSQSATFAQVSRTLFELTYSWHWYMAYAAIGCWLWFRRPQDRALWSLIMMVAATAVVSAYVQRKGFGYHFMGMLPALGLFATSFVCQAIERWRRVPGRTNLLVVGVVSLVAVGGLVKKQVAQLGPQASWLLGQCSRHEMSASHGYADTVEVAELVSRSVAPEGRVLVWSRAVHVNYLAARRSPSRFITVWMLDRIPDDFAVGRTWIEEFQSAFLAHLPEVIVLDAPADTGDGLLARPDPSKVIVFLREQMRTRYQFDSRVGALDVYRLGHGK